MNRFIRIFILIQLVGLYKCTLTSAQSLGFDTVSVFPQTAALNDITPAVVQVGIKNYGIASFVGNAPIKIKLRVTSGGLFVSEDSTTNIINQATILPGSTFPFSMVVPYNSGLFAVGIDVVVIWPKAINVATHDSITYLIHITPQVGVEELLAENGIMVYPNPCSDNLMVKSTLPENPIEQVRIYDLNGRLLLSKRRTETIDLSQIPDALYQVEISYKSGMRKVMRVQKAGK